MRTFLFCAVWLAAGAGACGGDPVGRETERAPAVVSGGSAGADGWDAATANGGMGGERSGGSGSTEHDAGAGSSSSPVVDASTNVSDGNSEPAAATCPAGGTGFTILGDAEEMVRDNATCLTWDRSHAALGFQESQQHCQDLALGGYDDWRMPTVEELYSLVRRNNAGNIDSVAFPNAPGSCWTSTQPDAMHSCAVGFDSGGCYKYGNSAGVWGTYCVRGVGASLPPLSTACKMACGI